MLCERYKLKQSASPELEYVLDLSRVKVFFFVQALKA